MASDSKSDYLALPGNLPVPEDDGQASHLIGMSLPEVALTSTTGDAVLLNKLPNLSVIFIYPMTGVPGVALPQGWDDVPGARGCTPQACAYRDSYQEIRKIADAVFGLSNQVTSYQREFRDRVHLPYELLSDSEGAVRTAMNLPHFELHGKSYLKRLTMIIKSGVIKTVHYPVFPSNEDALWVLETLANGVEN